MAYPPLSPHLTAGLCVFLSCALAASQLNAADALIYQETFNTDGSGTRYTIEGHGVQEIIDGQAGPGYWAHNFEVSVVGVPAVARAHRAILMWNSNIAASAITTDALELIDSTIAWLTGGKQSLRILYSPGPVGEGDAALVERLEAAGHTVTADEAGPAPDPSTVDLVIHSSSGTIDPNRFTFYQVPLLTFNGPDHDDELSSSIGAGNQVFDPGSVTIQAESHPAAGGKTGSLDWVTGAQPFDMIGETLPEGATVVATFDQEQPTPVSSLAEVDAMRAGTTPSTTAAGTLSFGDMAVGAPGNWAHDLAPPGNPTGGFATVATGKLDVSAAGTYGFALGIDDGARLRIDLDKNGLDANDDIIVVDSTGAFRDTFADVTFPAAGIYDFEWVGFNATGNFGAELSVKFEEGAGAAGPIDLQNWTSLGFHVPEDPVKLVGLQMDVTTYIPDLPPVIEKIPVLVAIAQDAPLLGGLIAGEEGEGFFAGASLNKFGDASTRALTLMPVDVTGEEDLKLTIALAGTAVDFEAGDFLRILADPDGSGPADFEEIANFVGLPNKALGDGTHELSVQFKDITYPLPENSTQLVIRLEALNTWFNEIVAFDNIRITAKSDAVTPVISIRKEGADIVVEYVGVLRQSAAVNGTFEPATGTSPLVITPNDRQSAQFFRSSGE